MNKAWDKIKQAWNDNPMAVILVTTLAANAAAKVLHEVVAARNSRTYALEVERRRMMR